MSRFIGNSTDYKIINDIEKFNPNHDELGRFTSGSGGKTTVTSGKRKKIIPKKRRVLQEHEGFGEGSETFILEKEFGVKSLVDAGILSKEDLLWCVNTYIHTVGFSGSEQDAMDEIGTDPAKFDIGGESDSLGELGSEGKAVFYKIVVQKQLSNGLKKIMSPKEMSDALTSLENLHKRMPNTSQIQFHGEAKDFVGGKDGKTNEQAILPNETLSTKGDSIYDATADAIIESWAGSSGSQISLMVSAYAQALLKAEGTYRETSYEETFSKAVWYFNTGIGEKALDKLLRASVTTIYENTQKLLDSQKITDVRVYRGFDTEGLTSLTSGKIVVDSINTRPIASWSLSVQQAQGFGDYLTTVVVPKSQVFSTPMTGMGCFQEAEIVLKGFDLHPAPVVRDIGFGLNVDRDDFDELANQISENPKKYEGG